MANQEVTIGVGRLSWSRYERIGDRYGSVNLFTKEMDEAKELPRAVPLLGKRGKLKARILRTRKSGHIGDLFRGLSPSTPEVGDVLVLGSGVLFRGRPRGTAEGGYGLRPDDDRGADWLDPEALYKCHDQTVELIFEVAR